MRTHISIPAILLFLAAFSGVGVQVASAQSLVVLQNLRGSEISADGRTVGGLLEGATSDLEAVFWRAERGFVHTGISAIPDGTGSISLSGNGQYLAGGIRGDSRSFQTSITGTTAFIPPALPSGGSEIRDMSYNGSTLVGFAQSQDLFTIVSWRWTPQTGLQGLPFQVAAAVSGDGRTITGTTLGSQSAVLRNGVLSVLPSVGGGSSVTFGNSINYDGSVIVGQSDNQPAIWVNGVGSFIPPPPGFTSGQAIDVSGGGLVVVCTQGGLNPFIWTQATGSVLLNNYFAAFGIDLSGYSLSRATVSDDGNVFAIDARSLATQQATTLIVTIPAPAGLAALGIGSLLASLRRRR